MKIRTLIVDDEAAARDRVRALLGREADVEIIGECETGAEALTALRTQKVDLLFLDIQMPEMDGFDVLRRLGREMPVVIFVTAFDHYAVKAFEVHALDYLLKPFNRERFHQAVRRAKEQIESKRRGELDERLASLISSIAPDKKYLERLVVKSVGRVFFLKTSEIDWIEASGNYLKLHVGRDSHMIRETMNSIEAKLDPSQFMRIHRSTIVNIDRIKELHPMFSGDYSAILRDGTELALSRNYRERFLELFEGSS